MDAGNTILRDEKLNKAAQKRLLRTVLITSCIFFALSALVLSPLYVLTANDIVFMTTNLPELIELGVNICDVAVYAVCYSAIIYSIYRLLLSRSMPIIVTYCTAVFAKYTVNLMVTFAFDKSISASDIGYVLLYFMIEMLQLTFVIIIACAVMRGFYKKLAVIEKAGALLGKAKATKREQLFPFCKIFDFNNPLQKISFLCGLVLSLFKIITRVIYDLYYGAPSSAVDLIWMIVYYVSDIAVGFVIYLISLLVLTKNDKADMSALVAYEQSAAGRTLTASEFKGDGN